MDAIEEKAFILKDKKLKNLNDLYSAISELSDEEYSHYASLHHNYFADWVQYVLEEKELAEELRSADSRAEALKRLNPKSKNESRQEKPVPEIETVQKEESKPKKAEIKSKKPEMQESVKIVKSKEYTVEEEQEMKHYLWHHHPWEMAKEFMYGLALGIIVGLIISRIILP